MLQQNLQKQYEMFRLKKFMMYWPFALFLSLYRESPKKQPAGIFTP